LIWVTRRKTSTEDKYLGTLRLLAKWYCKNWDVHKAFAVLEKIAAVNPYDEAIFSEIEDWCLAHRLGLSLLREFKRHLDWLRDGDKVDHPSPRLLDSRSERQLYPHR
jgi:two-component SAPR family response regulator